jgi:hypothetical protein
MDIEVQNPYGLKEGQTCDTIRIRHNPKGSAQEDVVVALPVAHFPNLQAAATEAYLHAKKIGKLSAGLMAVCEFSYRDDEQDAWCLFDPADF